MRRDKLTIDLFDEYEPEAVTVGFDAEVTGRGALDNQIARIVSRALSQAQDKGVNRDAIAERMTEFLQRKISKDSLDKWASEGATGHRIPFDAYVALVSTTGCIDLLGFAPNRFGFAVVPEKYASVIELHLLEEKEQKLAARKNSLMAGLRGMRS